MKVKKPTIRLSIVASLVSVMTICTYAQADTGPFVEQDGRLLVEVEIEPAGDNWALRQDIYGYTGTGFLVWEGGNNLAESEATRGQAITYTFRIAEAGNYQLRWRSRNSVGLDATEHNDSWVQFPTGQNIEGEQSLDGWTKAYMGQVAQWTWDAFTVDGNNKPIRQYFEAGEHTILIAGRSTGHALDRFALYRYDEEEFDVTLFDALATSPKDSEQSQAAHTYTGNSCYAGTLSLAAQQSMQYSDSGSQTTLLSFDIPELSDESISLLLTAQNGVLDQSAYLGSDSSWTDSSESQPLPSATVLLGTYSDDVVQGTIQSLDIDAQLLTSDITTLMLISDNEDPQSPFDIGTRPEPRLQIEVGATACNEYNSLRISGDETATEEESEVDEQTPDEESGGGDSTEEENTSEETNEEESSSGPVVVVEESVDEETDSENAVEEESESTEETTDETTGETVTESQSTDATASSSSSSGAIGYWGLILSGFLLSRIATSSSAVASRAKRQH